MNIHFVQHVPFEGVAAIADWAEARGHELSGTQMYRCILETVGVPEEPDARAVLPSLDEFELLIVMGGPMSVRDEEQHPWLVAEKQFIRASIEEGKAVLGICLGAQLVAEALGGEITECPTREIGWYPVELTEAGQSESVFLGYPRLFTALHWHGETFSIPAGTVHAASSAACTNQALSHDGGRVVALQFHLETTPESLSLLAEAAADNLAEVRTEPWIATREEMLDPSAPYEACRDLLFRLLDSMAARIS